MSFSNFMRAGFLVFGLAGLSACDGGETYPDGVIPPLDPPNGSDTTLPDTARNRFDRCFPPDQSLTILLDGRGAVYGNPPSLPADGSSVVAIDRESLHFDDEAGGGDAGVSSSPNYFRAVGRWASAPLEFFSQDPGDSGYGLMATRTAARANGDPLTNLRRSGMTGSWADQFPDFPLAAQLGFLWWIDGDFDSEDCRANLRIRGAVRTTDGLSDPMEEVAVPLYAPRPDGLTGAATSTFSNEAVGIMSSPIEVSLDPNAESVAVCDGDCATVPGSVIQGLDARLIVAPFNPDAGPGGAGGGSPDGGAGGSGG